MWGEKSDKGSGISDQFKTLTAYHLPLITKNRAEMRTINLDGFGRGDVEKNARELTAGDATTGVEDLNTEHATVLGDVYHDAIGNLPRVFDFARLELDVQSIRFTIERYFHFLSSSLKPVSRYENYLRFLAPVNDSKNLIMELFIRQTPSTVAWLCPVGMGYSLFDLFRDQLALADPLLGMTCIFKNHIKYDKTEITEVKRFSSTRSEARMDRKSALERALKAYDYEQIKEVTPEIFDKIKELEANTNVKVTSLKKSVLEKYLSDPEAVIFIARDRGKGGEIVGYTFGLPQKNIPGTRPVFSEGSTTSVNLMRTFYVMSRQVLPEYQGRGIGTALRYKL
jgi:hypothetical protein